MKLRIKWPTAPRLDNAIYTDSYLDYWADRYISDGWLYRGVTLMQFLARPTTYVNSDRTLEPEPLLGKQLRVRAQLMQFERQARDRQPQRDGEPLDVAWFTERARRQLEELPRRNGRIVEPLHHHAHPRNKMANFNHRRGQRS